MPNLQVTIGAGVTQVTTSDIAVRQVTFQNNASNTMRVGDASTTSTVGMKLAASGSATFGPFETHPLNLKTFYVAGTQNDVLDVFYTI